MRHIETYDGSDILCQKNGDKARFGKERKKKNLRRKRTNEYRLKIVHEDGTKELGSGAITSSKLLRQSF
jgi:hypothetical protein